MSNASEFTLEQLHAMTRTGFLPAHAFDYYEAVKQLFVVLTERADLSPATPAADGGAPRHWMLKAGADQTACGLDCTDSQTVSLLVEYVTCVNCKHVLTGYMFGRADERALKVSGEAHAASEPPEGLREACRIAMWIANTFYPEQEFVLLSTMSGVLSQIDNAIVGVYRRPTLATEGAPK